MVIVGIVGYVATPKGLRALRTVWAEHIGEDCRRRFYKNWYGSKKKAFSKYAKNLGTDAGKEERDATFKKLADHAHVIRVVAHTQIDKLNLRQKKAHIMEIQVNGGSGVPDKLAFAKDLFEKSVPVSSVFEQDEMIDVIGITKGHGFEGLCFNCVRRFF